MSRQPNGFTLLELLIATALSAVIAAAIAATVPSLQAFFERTPSEIDLQQRGRTAVDAIAQAVRAADRLTLLDGHPAGTHFRQLMTIAPKLNAARGIVQQDQLDPGGDLALSAAGCPAVANVCGFVRNAVALIADVDGSFELFTIGATDAALRLISPRRSLNRRYAAGATVLEVEAYTFRLDPQPDGSHTLVRETGNGAVQPIADRVSDLQFAPTFGDRGIDVMVVLQRQRLPESASRRRIGIVARNLP